MRASSGMMDELPSSLARLSHDGALQCGRVSPAPTWRRQSCLSPDWPARCRRHFETPCDRRAVPAPDQVLDGLLDVADRCGNALWGSVIPTPLLGCPPAG